MIYKKMFKYGESSLWKYYMFFYKDRMVYFTDDFDQMGYNNEVKWEFFDEENFTEVEISPEIHRKIIRMWWGGTNDLW